MLHYVCLHIRPLQNYQKYYQLQGRLDRKGLDTDVGSSRKCSGVFPPEIIPTKLESYNTLLIVQCKKEDESKREDVDIVKLEIKLHGITSGESYRTCLNHEITKV